MALNQRVHVHIRETVFSSYSVMVVLRKKMCITSMLLQVLPCVCTVQFEKMQSEMRSEPMLEWAEAHVYTSQSVCVLDTRQVP